MAWTKVTDIAYGRLKSPDLDVAEEFLTRFGMHRAERTANALYMRGTDPAHHIHITEKGDPKFVGIAYYVDSEDDLKKLAKAPGATGVENIDEPGGGKRVRLTEPNGYQIEVVCGIEQVAPIPVKRQKLNSGEAPTARAGELIKAAEQVGPSSPAYVTVEYYVDQRLIDQGKNDEARARIAAFPPVGIETIAGAHMGISDGFRLGQIKLDFQVNGVSYVDVSLLSPLPSSRILAAIRPSVRYVIVLEQVQRRLFRRRRRAHRRGWRLLAARPRRRCDQCRRPSPVDRTDRGGAGLA